MLNFLLRKKNYYKSKLTKFSSLLATVILMISCSVQAATLNPCLSSLDLRGNGRALNLRNCGLVDADMPVVFDFIVTHSRITEVWLSNNHLTDRGLSGFSTLPNSEHALIDIDNNNIGPKGASLLATNPNLKYLSIANNHIGDAGAIALANAGHLLELTIQHNDLTSKGALAILQKLKLDILSIGDKTIGHDALLSLKPSSGLKELEIHDQALADNEIAAITASQELEYLTFDNASLSPRALKLLINGPQLELLEISHNKLDDNAASILAKINYPLKLALKNNQIGLPGVQILTANKNLALNLSGNPIGDQGAYALAQSQKHTASLANIGLTDAGVAAIERLPKLNWSILDVSDNTLTNKSLPMLLNIINKSSVKYPELNISHTNIKDEAFAGIPPIESKSIFIDVEGNHLTSVKYLAAYLRDSNYGLNISNNYLQDTNFKEMQFNNLQMIEAENNIFTLSGVTNWLQTQPTIQFFLWNGFAPSAKKIHSQAHGNLNRPTSFLLTNKKER